MATSPGQQQEVNLVDEEEEQDPLVKKGKEEVRGRRVKQMSRQELEKLVESKITELLQYKGEYVALGKKVDKLQEENKKLSDKAAALGKQMADLKEVVRRVKEAEKKKGEGKVTKIPRVTRNVGLQITATLAPVQPPSQPTPSPSPSLSEEDIVLIDDEEEEEGETRVNTMAKSPKQATFNALPRGNGRRSLPAEAWPRSNGDGGQGPRPKAAGGAAALSKSLLGTHSSRLQLGTSKGPSNNRKGNLPLPGSLQTSLSSGSLSITRTSSPISPATRDVHEPITLTVTKVDQGGIMVQWAWNKASNFDISKVVSYQLEGSQGHSDWTKVGDPIVPLNLPMACTLNGFKTGVTYGFRIKIQTRVSVLHSNVAKIDL